MAGGDGFDGLNTVPLLVCSWTSTGRKRFSAFPVLTAILTTQTLPALRVKDYVGND